MMPVFFSNTLKTGKKNASDLHKPLANNVKLLPINGWVTAFNLKSTAKISIFRESRITHIQFFIPALTDEPVKRTVIHRCTTPSRISHT